MVEQWLTNTRIMGTFYLDNQQNGWPIEWRYKDDKRGVMINHSLLIYILHTVVTIDKWYTDYLVVIIFIYINYNENV